MKRSFLALIVVIMALAVYFLFFKKDVRQSRPEPQPLAVSSNPAFDSSFETLLTAYEHLKDALVKSDAAAATTAAAEVAATGESLSIDDIEGDTEGLLHETATSFKNMIVESARLIAAETDIEQQRVQFENMAESVWSLTRTVKYSAQKVYLQHCPMAFDNRGANWVSLSDEILNPYFGDKMLKCGVVKDSTRF